MLQNLLSRQAWRVAGFATAYQARVSRNFELGVPVHPITQRPFLAASRRGTMLSSSSGASMPVQWRIERQGRAWRGDEAMQRWELTPGRLEMVKGKLLWDEESRLGLLGLLLENVGADAAVRLGDPSVSMRQLDRLRQRATTPPVRSALRLAARVRVVARASYERVTPGSRPLLRERGERPGPWGARTAFVQRA